MAYPSAHPLTLCLLSLALLAAGQGSPQRSQQQRSPFLGPHRRRQMQQQDQRFRVLPPHQQPQFDRDDGGAHRPATVSDHYCRLSGRHSLCRQPHTRLTCGYVKRRTLNYDEAAMILHRHNVERMMLAQGLVRGRDGVRLPQGADIMQMVSSGRASAFLVLLLFCFVKNSRTY